MQTARGKTWRSRRFEAPARPAARIGAVPPPPPHTGAQRVWAFMCPNPACDTELVVFPDHSGERVQCPTCGFEFTAPRMVPLQILSTDGTVQPPVYTFARGAIIARLSPQAPPRTASATSPSAAPSAPPPTEAPTPETAQAAAALGSLAGGTPVAPPQPQVPQAPPAPARRTAADALDALARAAVQPGAHPAPARVQRRAVPRRDRRETPRAEVTPPLAEAPARSTGGKRRTDLVLTWAVAVVVSIGLGLAAWGVNVPDLALGSILFIGLACLRTFLVAKRKRTDRPPG